MSEERWTFTLPDLGEGLIEAEIVSWRVHEGDDIRVDDVVVEVETAKATVEVPCPYAGHVDTLHAAPGEIVRVGAPLLTIGSNGSGPVLVGSGVSREPARRRRRSRAPGSASGSSAPRTNPAARAPRVLSPVVRRLARDQGVDVRQLLGSGPAGIIVRRDVEAAVRASNHTPSAKLTADDTQREVLRGLRRTMAEKVAQSRREIPDATTWVDVDATALVEARDVLHSDTAERPIGLLALVARITIAALARFPALNSSVDVSGSTIAVTSHPVINLGFAVQTSRGLVVPVIHGAGKMSTSQLATEMGRLTLSAHNNGLTAHDLTGGTFTVNNYGVFGVDGSTPIVNYPEAAILGLGRIIDKPWVVNGSLAVRKVGQLSLTFDHRVCDGATAGGFLRYVADGVESPLRLLADM